ncbi:MAG: hypothetical protein K2I60_03395, partial [Oscillospiraceae bacterium]|nr:hypothetical protein [Oscillospiraceae bacterium]
ILTLCMVGISFVSILQVNAQTDGEQNQFVINSEDDFSKLMMSPEYWENNYKITLARDIDMTDKEFKPIEIFNGKFDGNGHTIKNLTIKDKSAKESVFYLAFIKTLGSSTEFAEFKNVTFDNYTIKDGSYKILKYNPDLFFTTSDYCASGLVNYSYGTISGVNIKNGNMININKPEYFGSVAGFVIINEEDGIIENCSVDMKSEKSNIDAGFVCSNFGKIINSSTTLSARGSGFVNTNYDTIEGCSSTGDVTGGKEFVGGFVIKNCNKGIINNCKATGTIKTDHKYGSAGGFAGINSYGTIKNSTACGDVKGKSELSGFISSNYAGTIINCEATGNVTGSANSDASGFVGKNKTYRSEF